MTKNKNMLRAEIKDIRNRVKKTIIKRLFATTMVTLIIVFLIGQYLGIRTIKYYFLQAKIEELEPIVNYIAEEISNGDAKLSMKKDFIIKAYDLYKNEINIFDEEIDHPINFNDELIKKSILPYMSKALVLNKVTDIIKIEGLPSESIIIGMPIVKNSKIIGTMFLLKPASDYRAALNGFYMVFLSTSLLGAIVILNLIYFYTKTAKGLEQTRRDYIANVSHELKSPIASIKALTETLCDNLDLSDETKDRYYHIIYNESGRLERLITDMLELSRLQSGKIAFEKNNINGKELMKKIDDKFSALGDDLGIKFQISEKAQNLPYIYTNEDRISQVLNILIDNAFKFTDEDGEVVVDARYSRNIVTILIKDTGVGIKKEDIPFVFDRFYKGDKSHSQKGSGLGLAIAKEIVENLGEKIEVNSEYGKGTEFSFTVHFG